MKLEFNSYGKSIGIIPRIVEHPVQKGVFMEQVHWDVEHSMIALKEIVKMSETEDEIEFEGHPEHWLMCAIVDQTRPECHLTNFIPQFEHPFPMPPYSVGEPDKNGRLQCHITTSGDKILVDAELKEKGKPDEMMSIVVPDIEAGKDVFISCSGVPSPIFVPVGLSGAYGKKCRSLFVACRDGGFYCAIANDETHKVGEFVEKPW